MALARTLYGEQTDLCHVQDKKYEFLVLDDGNASPEITLRVGFRGINMVLRMTDVQRWVGEQHPSST